MAEDDIYGNKLKYDRFKKNYKEYSKKPDKRKKPKKGAHVQYCCLNKANLVYFPVLFNHFEAKDTSFIRRNRLLQTMRLICHAAKEDLKTLDRKGVDAVVAFMRTRYKAPKSQSYFVQDLKYLWKVLFPEKDERGREDESLTPYTVRHLSSKVDKSRQRVRKDRFEWDEWERILQYFKGEPQMQAYLSLALESLARPQEILFLRVGNVKKNGNYARIELTEHGKEGVGVLQCIDSFPYLLSWLQVHPYRNDPEAYLFVNHYKQQLTPHAINKKLRAAIKALNIKTTITCYSLKRNGVSFRRARGETDFDIQKAARWTTTKQLSTYDLTTEDDAFKRQLARRGLIKDDKYQDLIPKTLICPYCEEKNGYNESICSRCKRNLNSKDTVEEQRKLEILEKFLNIDQVQNLFKTLYKINKRIETLEQTRR